MSENLRRAFLACTRGDFAVLESLVPSKVKVNEAIFQFYFNFFVFIWSVSSVTCRHAQMIHIASGCGKTNCISYLLHLGADPNAIDLLEILKL